MIEHNIDHEEVNKFENLAEEWWNPTGKLKTLHDINPLRLSYVQNHATLSGQQLLDVGCGGGIFAEGLAKAGAKVTGIDLSAGALEAARHHAQINGLIMEYVQTTVESFATQHPARFDIVTCMELLEHVPDPASVIRACATLVKPGGKLFFSTINRNPKAYLYAILGAEYLLRMLPQGTHDYAKFIRPSELAAWAREAGLTVNEFKGLGYNLLTQEYSLTDDISVNYLVCVEKNN